MALVAPLGVTLSLVDEDVKCPGYARWDGGETFTVVSAMAAAGPLQVVLKRDDEMLFAFMVSIENVMGVFAGDSFVLQGAGPAIAANIYELIDEGVFLNGQD